VKPRSLVRWLSVLGVAAILAGRTAAAADVQVMISSGFYGVYSELGPAFERASGHHLVTTRGPSMGDSPEAIPTRLARGEAADVVILDGGAADELGKRGLVRADSKTVLARSLIGMVVRAGADKPDISSVEAFKRALANAKSIAYSDSASGVYIETVLYKQLGVSEEVKAKSKMIPADPVGEIVARGEAELGFQQVSELMPVKGIDLLGPIPQEIQKVTIFSAAVATGAKEPEAGAALIKFLASPAAARAITDTGLELITSH